MRITVFGAAGGVGRCVVEEALGRGHEVLAVARREESLAGLPEAAERALGDASDADRVAELSADRHLVLSATRPAAGREAELAQVARALLSGVARSGARLLLVGGAASLTVPGSNGTLVLDDPRYVPPAWRAIALACRDQLDVCLAATEVDWTYLSPPASLAPGRRTGSYRSGLHELLVDRAGASRISTEDLAVALVDEAERPAHRRRRFTVAY